MNRRRTVSRCALHLESLEEKALLAGDVSVAIVDGELFVRGDHESNHIAIRSNAETERVTIVGLPDGDGNATTLNGQSEPIRIDGIGRDVQVRMGPGADRVDVPAGPFSNLTIGMGRGHDRVHLGTDNGCNGWTSTARWRKPNGSNRIWRRSRPSRASPHWAANVDWRRPGR